MQLEIIHFSLGLIILFVMNAIGGSTLLTTKYTGFSDFFNYDSSVGFNAVLRILAPSIFTVIISIIFYQLGQASLTHDIWHAAVYYAIVQTLLVFLILGRGKLVKKTMFFIYHLFAIMLAYWVYNAAIVKGVAYLLPDEANFRTEMWLLTILFTYGLLTHLEENRNKFIDRRKQYVFAKVKYFKSKYGHLLEESPELVENVVYALMTYEDYVRPSAYRFIERFLIKMKGARTTGIMQVNNSKTLRDEESIAITVSKIKAIHDTFTDNMSTRLQQLVAAHNEGDNYFHKVYEIYETIQELYRDEKLKR